MFVVLLSFIGSLAHVAKVSDETKCISLNDQPSKRRPTITDPVDLKITHSWLVLVNVVETVIPAMAYL